MATVRLQLGVKKAAEGCARPLLRRRERRRERRSDKQLLHQVAAYDPAHWPAPDYAHD